MSLLPLESPSLHDQVVEIVLERGLTFTDEPIALRSGELSHYFIDGKAAFSRGRDLALACRAIVEAVAAEGATFDAVGGLTMGADQFSHAIAVLYDKEWFAVRKERKGRGTNKLIEGAIVTRDTRVLLVDDVVTIGDSIEQAYAAVGESGVQVVAAATLVDRGETARKFFEGQGVPYIALVTYRDLGIPPVGVPGVGLSA